MKLIYSLFFAGTLITNAGFAQKTPATPAKQPVKDTLAINLLNTVDKVIAMATNEKIAARAMLGEFIGVTAYSEYPEWYSITQFPGSTKTISSQTNTFRDQGTTRWTWSTSFPKTSGVTKDRIEKILQTFNIKSILYKNRNFDLGVNDYNNEMSITIEYYKGLHNTEQQAVDSLVQIYKPLLMNKQTANKCAERLGKAFSVEDVSKETALACYKKMVKQIADTDIAAAYETLTGIQFSYDDQQKNSKILLDELSYTQQEQIRTQAKKVITDYNAQFNKGTTQTSAVVAQKKEIEKAKLPTDPCEREIWELKLKPGNYISGKGWVGQITGYSCKDDTYTIAWFDAKAKRITLEKNVFVSATSTYSPTYNAPFMICRHCQGEGHSLEYEWTQVNVASSYYARSNKQNKIPCGACGSKGCIIVR